MQTPANRLWKQNNPSKYLLSCAKARAKKCNKDFDIDLSDIIIPIHCPIMGVPLTVTLGFGHINTNVSLDRIDNSKGYVKGNVQVISKIANMMKNNATDDELLMFAYGIINYLGEKSGKPRGMERLEKAPDDQNVDEVSS